MGKVFIWVLENSMEISIVILLVLLLRLFMKRQPKLVCYGLWIAVFLRLICPVEIVTPVGLLPQIAISSSEGISLSWTDSRQEADALADEGAGKAAEENGAGDAGKRAAGVERNVIDNNAGTAAQTENKTGSNDGRDMDSAVGFSGEQAQDVEEAAAGEGFLADNGREGVPSGDIETRSSEERIPSGDIETRSSEERIPSGDIEIRSSEEGIPSGDIETRNSEEGILTGGSEAEKQQGTVPLTRRRWFQIVLGIWGLGVLGMLQQGIFQAVQLQRDLTASRKLCYGYRRGAVYETEHVSVPFVFGLFRPSIYLPDELDRRNRRFILLHEQTHICRYDYLIKYAAYGILCIYWFHPLVWLAYFMLERDMEYACDESVIRQIPGEQAAYSEALLAMAVENGGYRGVPLAFSEKNTRARIKNVLSFQRPGRVAAAALGVLVALGVLCVMTTGGFHRREHTGGSDSRTAGEAEVRDTRSLQEDTGEEAFGANAPCFITDKEGNIVSTMNFGRRGDSDTILMEWTAFPVWEEGAAEDGLAGYRHYSILEDALGDCSLLKNLIIPSAEQIDYVAEDAFDNSGKDKLTVYCAKGTYLWDRLEELGIRRRELGEDTELKGTVPTMVMSKQGEVLGLSTDYLEFDQILEYGLTFPPETTAIGGWLCSNYYRTISVTIPENVTEIKEGAFNSSGITSVTFQGKKLKRIGANAFYDTGLKKIKLPEGVEEIGKNAFPVTEHKKKIILPSTLKTLGEGALSGKVSELVVRSREVNYMGDGFLHGMDKSTTVRCYRGSTTENYLLSHFSKVRVKYLEEDPSNPDKGQEFSSESSPEQELLDTNREQAIAAATGARFDGNRAGTIYRIGKPGYSRNWKVYYFADVTGDKNVERITLQQAQGSNDKDNYYVTVESVESGHAIWKWSVNAAQADGAVKSLGLYYWDGSTYLLEMVSSNNTISYEIFQLNSKGKRVTQRKEQFNFKKLSRRVDQGKYTWEEYNDRNQKWNRLMMVSDLMIRVGSSEDVVCSIREQRWSMYGNTTE